MGKVPLAHPKDSAQVRRIAPYKCEFYNFQARPGNQCPEALPRLFVGKLEAEPPDMRYQAEPVNE